MASRIYFSIGLVILLLLCPLSLRAKNTASGVFKLEFGESLKAESKPKGRVFIFLNENLRGEPRTQIWPLNKLKNHIFAKNLVDFNPDKKLNLDGYSELLTTASFGLNNIPKGRYMLQVLWDVDTLESGINAPTNLYSEAREIVIGGDFVQSIVLSKKIPQRKLEQHPLIKKVTIKSKLLSEFWGRPYNVMASLLLPKSYQENPQKKFPIRYNVGGYGGRYTRVNNLVNSEGFMQWWMSEDAPQIINVFLDGEGPYGDSYQLDSVNSGPFGSSLINELIPAIENQYRAKNNAKYRFVDGCSTGGWVSLALQLFYPDTFNGVWSYSPDSVDFSAYQLTDIYKDNNVYYNEWNNLRPVARDLSGEPMVTMREFIAYENVFGVSNDYRTSGGQFSAHTALYSPVGDDGLPAAMFNPKTGEINHDVVEYWKKYDLKLYVEKHWKVIGPKLQNKIHIWMGDMDNFYLNPATRKFADFLNKTEKPKSNAVIQFDAMEGHCSKFSSRVVLKNIGQRLKEIK